MEFSTQNTIDIMSLTQYPVQYIDYDDMNGDDEGVLVRSTPKPVKFVRRFEEISKKLNFNE